MGSPAPHQQQHYNHRQHVSGDRTSKAKHNRTQFCTTRNDRFIVKLIPFDAGLSFIHEFHEDVCIN